MLSMSGRTGASGEQALFREQVRGFLVRHATPQLDRWDRQGFVDRAFWELCGEQGLLCPNVAERFGGLGLDFGYNAIINEELAYIGCSAGLTLQSDITAHYLEALAGDACKAQWLSRMIGGTAITALAMTEADAGSDLKAIRTRARRTGDNYVISGAKTYITNGQLADLVLVLCSTDPTAGRHGLSLIAVEADRAGFVRGRNLDKIGQHAADTSELFFEDVEVPVANLLGVEGSAFGYVMQQLAQERLSIAIAAQAGAQRAFDEALAFTRGRKAFGGTVFDFQATRFALAALAARLQAGWAHIDWAVQRHVAGQLTAAEASAAKYLHTELQWECCDRALQLHGGAGYMNETPIARLWRDARVTRIYGGTSEIMLEVVARDL